MNAATRQTIVALICFAGVLFLGWHSLSHAMPERDPAPYFIGQHCREDGRLFDVLFVPKADGLNHAIGFAPAFADYGLPATCTPPGPGPLPMGAE